MNSGNSRLLKLWRISFINAKRLRYGILTGREIRLIVINALGVISEGYYEETKSFILSVLNDLMDWETFDSLALRVVVNIMEKNREEIFTIITKWINSGNKWVRRLAMATIASYIRIKPEHVEFYLGIIGK